MNKQTSTALILFALMFVTTPGALAQDGDFTDAFLVVEFGPNEIWRPTRTDVTALHHCQSALFSCVREAMEAGGASPEAVAFYHLTGWFLTNIAPTQNVFGPVMLGTILNPWRANENEQPVLLGGVPDVIFPEQEGQQLAVERDADYAQLRAAYPKVMLWAPGPTLEETTDSPSGGQRFILRYRLLDGCHACAVLGLARAAFDFAPDGTYQGLQLLEIIPRGDDAESS